MQHLAARQNIVNSLAQEAWKALSNSPSNVVAYGVGLGKVSNGALHPSNAKISMGKEDANTENLSRVLPNPIENATMICLPQITNEDYEKGITKSVPSAVHYCDNAMVIADKRRKSSGKTIVYDLRNIDKGVVVGSNKLNNNFLISQGATEITGGNNVVNRFAFVNDTSFSGKIIGGSNSTNILDLSTLTKDKVIKVSVDAYPSLKVKVNDHLLINDTNLFSYYYTGRQKKVDKVSCTDHSKSSTGNDNRDVVIDSGGGFDNDVKDIVENCKKVIISPYTTVKGGKGSYAFHVKAVGYKGRDLHSEIDVRGAGTVIFPGANLLDDCDEITYSSSNNTLFLKIRLDRDSQYTLDIKNYIEQSSNKPNFILVDKNGSNIVPKIRESGLSTAKINLFELHTEYPLDNFDSVENHYKKVLSNNKDCKVFGIVRDKVQSQSNSTVPHMMFGSSGDDIINFDQGAMFARGGNGSDIYVIDDSIGNREVKIDNNSDDKKLDTLLVPVVTKDFSIQQCDLYLSSNNTNIQAKNYLKDPNYRHLMVMNNNGETFIPYIESISCVGSSMKNGKLVPFFHVTQTQNMFFLSKDFQYDHVVIDSRSEDIEQYKDKGGLLLMREGEVPFTIKIKGYFDDQSRWKDVDFHLWNDGNFSYFDLPQEVNKVMSYQDKLKADYEGIVEEYVIDFTRSINITHNQNDDLTSIGQDEERAGLIILKGIIPCRVKVSSSGSDLVLRDTKSCRTINIKNWDSSESYRISILEFDLGLDPIKIRRLDRFSLSSVAEIQTLIDKASENYQNKTKCTTKVENDFKCLVSVNGFKNENKTYECLGFSSLQEQINFTEKFCSVEQIEKLKNKTPSSNRVITVLKKLKNDLSLSGYDQNAIGQCNELVVTSEFKPLISKLTQEGEWNKVKAFLDETANRSSTDIENKNKWSKSWTLLHYAVYNGNLNLVNGVFDLLLAKVGDINAKDKRYWTPLHYAVYYNEPHIVKFLIDKGANIESKNGEYQATPLHGAVANYRLDVVRLLLSRSANVNAEDKGHQTPLHYAANTDRLDIVKSLVDAGANLSATDDYGKTPLNIAKDKGHSSIAEYLEKKLNEKGEKPVQRKRRHYHGGHDRHHSSRKPLAIDLSNQPEVAVRQDVLKDSLQNDEIDYTKGGATSGASKPFSLIDTFANTIVDAGRGVFQFIFSPFRSAIDSQVGNTSKVVPEIKNISAQSDINGTILLFDVLLAKKGRRQIYTPSVDKQVSSLEAQAYALNIVNEFEPILKQAALRCGISVQQLKVDFQELNSSVLKKIMAGDYRGVSGILYSTAEKACPALEQKKKFSMSFKGKVEQMLQKEMMPLLDKGNIDPSSVSTNKAVALPSPRTNLNNISVTNNSTELIR